MDEAHKELVKRLRDQKFQYSGPQPDVMNEVADALEALAGEVERLTSDVDALGDNLEKVVAERDRLKAALGAIAVKAGKSECGGNYVAAISLIGDLEQMADAALRAAGDGR